MKPIKSTLRLFKAAPVESHSRAKPDKSILELTLPHGFIILPEVSKELTTKELNELIDIIKEELVISGEQMNSSFHKSWGKIKTASDKQLFIEQILHYITTYGFERLGCYDKDSIYIPNEKLEVPSLKDNINLIIIKGYTKAELKEKVLQLLSSGIALKEETINDIFEVCSFVKIGKKELDIIKNKEVKIKLQALLGIIPENPVEFLRYMVYLVTGKTLLIKNKDSIKSIKENKLKATLILPFNQYKKEFGLENLSQIFYRFKPIFLAFKDTSWDDGDTTLSKNVSRYLLKTTREKPNKAPEINSIINKIRKLAKKHHKPIKIDYLNIITELLSSGVKINKEELQSELERVNVFRKIRLAYALKFRLSDHKSIMYRVRNGKAYAKEFSFEESGETKNVLKIILESITKDISKNVKGKKIFIPQTINYTLPATEKQFTGNIPSGSYVDIPSDAVIGIHWNNLTKSDIFYGNRVDLDLKMISVEDTIGWDAWYRTGERDIMFSGDMTDAELPDGASELFYIKKQSPNNYILTLNYFNQGDSKQSVPFKIIAASEKIKDFKANYMVNPNNMLCIANSKIDKKQKVIGLITINKNGCRFYFAESDMGEGRSASNNEYIKHSRQYLLDFYKDTISLNSVLIDAGAKIVDTKEKAEIDLSPELLEKDSILKLLI